ncbi:hypothetical protein F4804DRAFT_336357 [Jackrogersella minutella]|nr:hypothetical protein F4804DRAFT_336357 [Jackrogersella minutella]
MESSSEQLPRVNSLITLMCQMEGIEPPSETAYTTEEDPLTSEHVEWIKALIREREELPNIENTIEAEDIHDNQTKTVAQPSPSPEGFSCTQCRRQYKSKKTLLQHMGDVHIGTRCFWPECNAVVPTESDLNNHLKQHNAVAGQGNPLVCDLASESPEQSVATNSTGFALPKLQ